MDSTEIRDKVEDIYINETGRFAFLDENKLDNRYIEWLESKVLSLSSIIFLKDGDLVKNGDEFCCEITNQWVLIDDVINPYEFDSENMSRTRRKVC